MAGHHIHGLGARDEVHSPADRGHRAASTGGPVGQVAVGGDLQCPEDADVEMAAADHREAVGMIKEGRSRHDRDWSLAGIDEFGILPCCRRRRAHSQEPFSV